MEAFQIFLEFNALDRGLERRIPGQGRLGKTSGGGQNYEDPRSIQKIHVPSRSRADEPSVDEDGIGSRWASISEQLLSYYEDVRNYLRKRAPAAATEDLAQETYVQAYKTIRDYGPPKTNPRRWLFGVARNTTCTYFRRLNGRSIGHLEDTEDLETPGPLEALLISEEIGLLPQAISELTEAEQALIRDRYWKKKSCRELGTALSVSPMAARLRLHRARQHLHMHYWSLIHDTGSDQE